MAAGREIMRVLKSLRGARGGLHPGAGSMPGSMHLGYAERALEELIRGGRRGPASKNMAHTLVAALLAKDKKRMAELATRAKIMRLIAGSGRTPWMQPAAGKAWERSAYELADLDFAMDEKKAVLQQIGRMLRGKPQYK